MNNATDEDYLRDEAQEDLKKKLNLEPSTGCWIDDRWGHYGSARLIQIAVDLGWNDEDAAELAASYMSDEEVDSDIVEQVHYAAEDAQDWLNDNVAKPGYYFGWTDGEFFLMHETWWVKEYS